MTALQAKKLLFGVAFFLLALHSFAAGKYPDSAKSTRTTVTVHIIWLPSFNAVNHLCSFLAGHPIPTDGIIVGCYEPQSQTIFAVEPKNFDDSTRLEILGHEFWHALGASHPEI